MTVKLISRRESGATLLVSLIILTLITLMVVSAFRLSMSNQKAIGNMQFRDQALAAANFIMEERLKGNLSAPLPAANNIDVDLNNDGTSDVKVSVAAPTCVAAILDESAAPSSLALPAMSSGSWNVMLDFDITATDASTGAYIKLRSGIRTLMSATQKLAWCGA